MSGIHIYHDIKNQNYASLTFDAIGFTAGLEELVGNTTVENVQDKAAKSGVDLKQANEIKDKDGMGTGIFEAKGNADVFNPNSDDFKNNFYGQVKDWALKGDHEGAQKRFWGLHVHDFEYVDKAGTVVKSFKFHYDAYPAASPLGTGLALHGVDAMIQRPIESAFGVNRNIDKSNSVIYRAIDSQKYRKP